MCATDKETESAGSGVFLPNILADRMVKIVLVGALAIYLALSWFSHPSLDDWEYYNISQSQSLAGHVSSFYYSFGGRFVSTALVHIWMANTDLIKHYWIFLAAIQISLIASLYALIRACASGRLGCRESAWWALFAYVCYSSTLSQPRDIYYWVTGALMYLPGMIFLVLLAALLIHIVRNPTAGWLPRIAAILLAGLTGGAHELLIPPLLAGLVVGGVLAYSVFRRLDWVWPAAFVCGGLASAILLVAPGNSTRAGTLPTVGAWSNMGNFPLHLHEIFSSWLGSPLLVTSALLTLPTLARLLPRPSPETAGKLKPFLALPAIWLPLLCILPVPIILLGNSDAPYRVRDMMLFLLMLFTLSELSLLVAYFKGKGAEMRICSAFPQYIAAAFFVLALLMSSNATRGMLDLAKRAAPYDREMQSRYEMIRQAKARGEKDVTVPPVIHKPWSLFILDLSTGPDFLVNRTMAGTFGVSTVVLRPPEAKK